MSARTLTASPTQTRLDRFRQESSRELTEQTLGCSCLECDKHPIMYSAILLSICLVLFVSLMVCIFYYTDDDEDYDDDYGAKGGTKSADYDEQELVDDGSAQAVDDYDDDYDYDDGGDNKDR